MGTLDGRDLNGAQRRTGPKDLGAYYTDSQVADFLVWWAVRNSEDTVLDPSFGGGVFLRSACMRLRVLGGEATSQVFGVEFDEAVHDRVAENLYEEFSVTKANMLRADFFEVVHPHARLVDAVVGNPPFIRYQRFNGEVRKRALSRAAEQGLKLSELTSSWLPYLVHSVGMLRAGGRLAMVVPFELGHAAYASPVLGFLARSFQQVTFLTFREKKLFPDLSEDTMLLLAEGRCDCADGRFRLRDLPHAGVLSVLRESGRLPLPGSRRLPRAEFIDGRRRLIEYLLPQKARDLYRELRDAGITAPLGHLADVGIGYVTGANDFFHLDSHAVAEWRIPACFLRKCVRRGRALAGLRFTSADWQTAMAEGEAGYLLELPSKGELPSSVLRYLAHGEKQGSHKSFKCRTRTPWYHVPQVRRSDAFLTYMSGDVPRLVANDAGVVAPNSLHILRLLDGRATSHGIAALWQTSLARLSAEIEGHSLGGGMLKMEPSEAENVLLPLPRSLRPRTLDDLSTELDRVSRESGHEESTRIADQHLLRETLGVSAADCNLLRGAALTLRGRRLSRN